MASNASFSDKSFPSHKFSITFCKFISCFAACTEYVRILLEAVVVVVLFCLLDDDDDDDDDENFR